MNDTPIWTEEIAGERVTLRGSIDALSDGTVYSTLAMEPNDGALRQHVLPLDRDGWIAVMAMAEQAVWTLDRLERREAA